MEKLLSISIAAYNKERDVERAIKSCLIKNEKILEKIEIIVVNDGSSDNTLNVIMNYVERYPDIIKVIDKKNGGYGSTVNAAIDKAEGKYFRLLDADDWYDAKELEKFVVGLRDEEAELIVSNYSEIKEQHKKNIIYSEREYYVNDVKKLDIRLSMHATCYKTKILKNNNIRLSEGILYTDAEFVMYPLCYVKKIKFVPFDIYQYSLGNEGQSVSINSRIKHVEDAKKICENLIRCYEMQEDNDNKIIENRVIDSIKFYLNSLLICLDKEHKAIFVNFDKRLESKNYQMYCKTTNKVLKIMRNTKYRSYYLCGMYVRRAQ